MRDLPKRSTNEAANAMFASIHECREKDSARILEELFATFPPDMQQNFEDVAPAFKHAFEAGWMKGADYGFHVMDKELGRKARSRFLPLFLARWYTRPRYTENPCKKPLAKYMRTQRAGLPASARNIVDPYAPSFHSLFEMGWRSGMEWGGRFAEVMWEPRFRAISQE